MKPNIIPAYTELEYYLRTPSRAELAVLKEKAERCFRSAAEATGCEVGAPMQVQMHLCVSVYLYILVFMHSMDV